MFQNFKSSPALGKRKNKRYIFSNTKVIAYKIGFVSKFIKNKITPDKIKTCASLITLSLLNISQGGIQAASIQPISIGKHYMLLIDLPKHGEMIFEAEAIWSYKNKTNHYFTYCKHGFKFLNINEDIQKKLASLEDLLPKKEPEVIYANF